jgi:hypothetical protein
MIDQVWEPEKSLNLYSSLSHYGFTADLEFCSTIDGVSFGVGEVGDYEWAMYNGDFLDIEEAQRQKNSL